jgi:hypothetical protein
MTAVATMTTLAALAALAALAVIAVGVTSDYPDIGHSGFLLRSHRYSKKLTKARSGWTS